MNKDIRHTIAMLMLLIFCVACNDQDITNGDDVTIGDEPIVLSASSIMSTGYAPSTRGIIDGQAKETAFEKHTRLTLLMVSENGETEPTSKKYSVTYGLAKGSGKSAADWTSTDGFSEISFASTQTSGTETQNYTDPTGTALETAAKNANADGSIRYWNDAHERKSVMSIYGFAVNGTILPCGAPWKQTINNIENTAGTNFAELSGTLDYTIKSSLTDQKWRVGNQKGADDYKTQTFLSLLYKDDICYSNNLSKLGDTDGRLKFNTTTKKFETGVLKFKRAMTMLSFKITPGAGFEQGNPNNFNFRSGTNIALRGFYKKGSLNIKNGAWDSESLVIEEDAQVEGKTYNWKTIANVTEGQTIDQISDHKYYLLALVIPGTDLTTTDVSDAVTIIIDENEYTISMRDLYNAIHDISANNDTQDASKVAESVLEGGTKLKAGNNYEFNITIAKTSVAGIEAKIVPWENAIASATASNSHVSLSLTTDQGTTVTGGGFSLYRTKDAEYTGTDYKYDEYAVYDWAKGYENPAANVTETDGVYDTEWYWPNNKTFYHFRTLVPTGRTLNNNTGDGAITSIDVTGGTLVRDGETPASAVDFQWGAPFKSGINTIGYSHEYGFCNNADPANGQIYKAIGATDDAIAITQIHMTSQVYVDLLTSDGSDKVNLTGATVQLTNIATTANLQLGNGLITGHGGYNNICMTADASASGVTPAYDYSYGVIPQKLKGNGNTTGPVGNTNGTVGVKITLSDGNEYIIEDLSVLKTTLSDGTKQTVSTWDPGKKYFYKFNLTKTGIEPLIATIVEWIDINSDNETVIIQ